jgi:1,4-alpha-glucan branching enzyme
VIAIPVSAAPGAGVSIAGDFTGWQLAPMEREGSMWVVRLPIEPGVYRYAFRSDDGRWFVPESVASRRDDGMGGHVAVLVVG